MTSWLKRTQAGIQSAPATPAVWSASPPGFIASSNPGRFIDPNAPDVRLDIESRCIYERRLPGNAYITAHITRLQDGFYDSPSTHGDCINNVRFLALSFVFHPSETINRFQSATVTISLHDDTDQAFTDPTPGHKPIQEPLNKPKFLRFAPHVLFGGVSPETLDWNFNLTGSLGVSQTPVSASLSPSGGLKGSYKLFQMMRIQGSTRTLLARHHHEYDIEDGEVWWTMEENSLQKSGLPREMTFVMLITKGDVENVVFDINIQPKVASWFGHYPGWWNNILKYRPLQKDHMDLDRELGQKFEPTLPGRGFNFANLAGTFNDFVSLPGTTYSLTDHAFANQVPVDDAKTGQNVSNQNSKQPSRKNTQQPQPAQAAKPAQPPARPQTVPPPVTETEQSEAPMDYHIYLHNPRTINLHATPPPQPSNSGSAPAPSRTPAPPVTVDFQTHQPANIPRPHSTAPTQHQRVSSPANTKMKRRSIDISNVMNSPYYDEPKPTTTTTPQRTTLGRSKSGSASGSRSGSLRRRNSKTDLRYTPLAEENSRSSGTSGSTNSNAIRSTNTSSRSRISPPRKNQQNIHSSNSGTNPSPGSPGPKSSTSQISPTSIIMEAPSPPDPGLSGFKARLQAHVASERERQYEREHGRVYPSNRDRDIRDSEREKERERDRLPFEIKPQPHRPPREMTPSPEPTEDPGSETTSDAGQDAETHEEQNVTTRAPTQSQSQTQTQTQYPVATTTVTPHRRERTLYDRSPESMTIPNHTSTSAVGPVNGITTPTPNHNPTPPTSQRPPTSSSPIKPYSRLPTSPPPAFPGASIATLPSPPPTLPTAAHAQSITRATSTSPPPPRNPSPYASPKYDSIRSTLANHSQPQPHPYPPTHTRTRRDSSASLSPGPGPDGTSENSQPSWGDLKEEARRRQRKRLSMPVGGFASGGVGVGGGDVVDVSGDRIGGRGYEYIVEADGEWDDR